MPLAPRFRAWAELAPAGSLLDPETLRLLRRFDVGACIRVQLETDASAGRMIRAVGGTISGSWGRPASADEPSGASSAMATDGVEELLADILARYAEAGIEVTAWLLLPEEQGYWPSEQNAELFSAAVHRLLAWSEMVRRPIPWLAVDLERPLAQTRWLSAANALARPWRQSRLALKNADAGRYQRAQAAYRHLALGVQGAGGRLLCAAHDLVLDDLRLGSTAMQNLYQSPVLGAPWDVVSVMLYGSLLVSTNPEAQPRPADIQRWVYEAGVRLRAGLGERAGASIGLTSAGALGNEAHYTRPEELAPDVAVLKAAGVRDLAVYSLEGILASANPAGWLEMLRATPARVPPPSAWVRRERARRYARALLARSVQAAGGLKRRSAGR